MINAHVLHTAFPLCVDPDGWATALTPALNFLDSPDLLLEKANAAMSAAWFWESRGLNALADDTSDDNDLEDFTEITRRINGSTVGLKERLALLNKIQANLHL